MEFSLLIGRDVAMIVGSVIGSSVIRNDDEHIVLESSLDDGRILAIILSLSSICDMGDGIRSLVVGEFSFGEVLYFDTCC